MRENILFTISRLLVLIGYYRFVRWTGCSYGCTYEYGKMVGLIFPTTDKIVAALLRKASHTAWRLTWHRVLRAAQDVRATHILEGGFHGDVERFHKINTHYGWCLYEWGPLDGFEIYVYYGSSYVGGVVWDGEEQTVRLRRRVQQTPLPPCNGSVFYANDEDIPF